MARHKFMKLEVTVSPFFAPFGTAACHVVLAYFLSLLPHLVLAYNEPDGTAFS